MKKELVIAIVGSGGDGIISAGEILAKSAAHEGLNVFLTKSYGPQIRGGESSCKIRVSQEQIYTVGEELDALFVFNWRDFRQFLEEYTLAKDCVILVEEKDDTPYEQVPINPELKKNIIKVPFERIAEEEVGSKLSKNMVLIGVILELTRWPAVGAERSVAEKFKRKGEDIVSTAIGAIEAGKGYAREKLEGRVDLRLIYERQEPKLFLTGNEALAYGAIVAGCRFYAGYPITPASEIMEWLATRLPAFGGTVVQAEDEIAAAGMAIGASYAGLKAMCATSGPGMSLKTEMIGLASMAEIPLVIVDVQRVGPSTGIPSKTEQADLGLAIYGSHGDAFRAVLAPVDVEDCLFTAIDAFNIAEEYQMPVIILSDQFLGQRKESFPIIRLGHVETVSRKLPNTEQLKVYSRYDLEKDYVSPMSIPGIPGGEYTAVGIEHDIFGNPSASTQMHAKMTQKRARKLERIASEHPLYRLYGNADADTAIVTWGSNKGVIREVINYLNRDSLVIKAIIPRLLHPLPVDALQKELKGVRRLLVVEQSYSGQFLKHLRAHLKLPSFVAHYSRAGGMPLGVKEILGFVSDAVGKSGRRRIREYAEAR